MENLWFLLNQENLQPVSGRPKHLLWALHFMKVYTKQAPGCAAVSASGGAINPKTHQKWVWAYIKAVTKLVDEVVSLFIVFYIYPCNMIGVGQALVVASMVTIFAVADVNVGAILVLFVLVILPPPMPRLLPPLLSTTG